MSENKDLLRIIKNNFNLKISHDEIETVIGKSIHSDEVIDLFGSIGPSVATGPDFSAASIASRTS